MSKGRPKLNKEVANELKEIIIGSQKYNLKVALEKLAAAKKMNISTRQMIGVIENQVVLQELLLKQVKEMNIYPDSKHLTYTKQEHGTRGQVWYHLYGPSCVNAFLTIASDDGVLWSRCIAMYKDNAYAQELIRNGMFGALWQFDRRIGRTRPHERKP